MARFLKLIYRLDIAFDVLAGIGLAFMMGVTIVDVVMRAMGSPIIGAVELICFSGAVVIGFAIPYASWKRAHVFVDLFERALPPPGRNILYILTRIIGIVLFLFIGYNFILYGMGLRQTGEVTPGLKLPFYPITYGLAVSCFLESLTLVCDLVRRYLGAADE
jgi:TRAP-type C4-dicarboxylate transport system permease small subunit